MTLNRLVAWINGHSTDGAPVVRRVLPDGRLEVVEWFTTAGGELVSEVSAIAPTVSAAREFLGY